MHRDLLIRAFEKAGAETGSGNTSRQARHLSDMILEASGEPFGERSLREYYKKAREGEGVELKGYVVSALCRYLGHEDYAAFLRAQQGGYGGSPRKPQGRWKKVVVAGVAVALLILLVGFAAIRLTQPRLMVWVEDHYEEADLDLEQHRLSELKAYNEDRILNFRKVAPDCSYVYFDEGGVERLWYGKNRKGELQFFTALGRHPETGKTLKRITPYMIRKYLCPTFKE
jgi:hypothetical protein